MAPKRPLIIYATLLAVASAIVMADQLTKQAALASLQDGPIDLFGGAVTLRLAFNPGGAFGILDGMPAFFLVATIVVVTLILVWARHAHRMGLAVALGLVLGGGLGNLFDRVFRDLGGRVVDFVDLHVWPIFNLADSAIVVGVVLVLLYGGTATEPTEASGSSDASATPEEVEPGVQEAPHAAGRAGVDRDGRGPGSS